MGGFGICHNCWRIEVGCVIICYILQITDDGIEGRRLYFCSRQNPKKGAVKLVKPGPAQDLISFERSGGIVADSWNSGPC